MKNPNFVYPFQYVIPQKFQGWSLAESVKLAKDSPWKYALLPASLTWNLKMMVSIRNLLFQGVIFRFHVKLWEGIPKNDHLPTTSFQPDSLFVFRQLRFASPFGGDIFLQTNIEKDKHHDLVPCFSNEHSWHPKISDPKIFHFFFPTTHQAHQPNPGYFSSSQDTQEQGTMKDFGFDLPRSIESKGHHFPPLKIRC